ncbi:hypothetical protein Naga_100003g179 [Nannochloropsis gaditana]|uniref:Uncharacterized protein n=1 Tax=Nannochloropsis gaditana TaxID=72520 RepID=W7U3B8_9STRA|nr:hypothetical protein Naga_100003g179 [Nannochloropsis gaditana]
MWGRSSFQLRRTGTYARTCTQNARDSFHPASRDLRRRHVAMGWTESIVLSQISFNRWHRKGSQQPFSKN